MSPPYNMGVFLIVIPVQVDDRNPPHKQETPV